MKISIKISLCFILVVTTLLHVVQAINKKQDGTTKSPKTGWRDGKGNCICNGVMKPTTPARSNPSGLHPSRRYPSRPHPSGPHPSRPHPSGPHPSGPHPSRPHPSGPHPSRPHPSGPHPSGPHPSRPHPSGPHPSGPHPSGPHPSGPHPSGPHPSGPHPSGPHPSGPHPSGPHPSGPHPSRPHPSRPHPSRPHPSGPHPSGPHPSRPLPSGPHPSGPHPSRPHPSGPHPSGPRPSGRHSHPSSPHPGRPHSSKNHYTPCICRKPRAAKRTGRVKIRMLKQWKEDYASRKSPAYKSLKDSLVKSVLGVLSEPATIENVYFTKGSIVAEFEIVYTSQPSGSMNTEDPEKALRNAIQSGQLKDLQIEEGSLVVSQSFSGVTLSSWKTKSDECSSKCHEDKHDSDVQQTRECTDVTASCDGVPLTREATCNEACPKHYTAHGSRQNVYIIVAVLIVAVAVVVGVVVIYKCKKNRHKQISPSPSVSSMKQLTDNDKLQSKC